MSGQNASFIRSRDFWPASRQFRPAAQRPAALPRRVWWPPPRILLASI